MIPYKTSPLGGTVHENGTVRTADDLFAKDIGAVEIISVHSKTAGMKIFTSYSVARIVRPGANFVATKLFYREPRKSVSETFPGSVDEVQVQAAIQIHRKRGPKAVLKSISFPIRSRPSVTKPRWPHACQTRWHRNRSLPSQAFHAPPGCRACAR